jgi:hypothetical protein
MLMNLEKCGMVVLGILDFSHFNNVYHGIAED